MISDVQAEVEDLDWFAVDSAGEIAHFTAGGRGFLPASIKESLSDLRALNTYFRKQPPDRGDPQVLPDVIQRYAQHSVDLRDYHEMGKRGLHSFDCMTNSPWPAGYFKIISPVDPIFIDNLPSEVRSIIIRTAYVGRFATTHEIEEVAPFSQR